jgi:predicted HicB family RNase H-like nuclease
MKKRYVFTKLLDMYGIMCFAGGRDPDNDAVRALARAMHKRIVEQYEADAGAAAESEYERTSVTMNVRGSKETLDKIEQWASDLGSLGGDDGYVN